MKAKEWVPSSWIRLVWVSDATIYDRLDSHELVSSLRKDEIIKQILFRLLRCIGSSRDAARRKIAAFQAYAS